MLRNFVLSFTTAWFTSCSPAPEFKAKHTPKSSADVKSSASESPPSNDSASQEQATVPKTSAPTTENPPAMNITCADRSKVQTASVDVLIPKNDPENDGKRCPFGQNDNNRHDSGTPSGKYTARIERRFDIKIPQNRRVCSMSAAAPMQKITYDDHLFLTLNNNVLMASRGIPTSVFSRGANGFFNYDWSKIRGTKESGSSKCADGTTCELPGSEETGTFSFKFSDEANNRLFDSLAKQQLFFSMILTGDDNPPIDCRQKNDLTLKVTYTYVEN